MNETDKEIEKLKIHEALKISKASYDAVRKEEQRVINYIMNVWTVNTKPWTLELTPPDIDLLGIDAIGTQKNKTSPDTKLLIQFKQDTWLSLPSLQQSIYLRRISENMSKYDPDASQRLIVYRLTGKKIRIWNYSIKKLIENPIINRNNKKKKTRVNL